MADPSTGKTPSQPDHKPTGNHITWHNAPTYSGPETGGKTIYLTRAAAQRAANPQSDPVPLAPRPGDMEKLLGPIPPNAPLSWYEAKFKGMMPDNYPMGTYTEGSKARAELEAACKEQGVPFP